MKWLINSLYFLMPFIPIQGTIVDSITKQKLNCLGITIPESDTLKVSYGNKLTVSLNSDSSKYSTNGSCVLNFQQISNKRDYVNLIFPILTLILGFFLNRGYDNFTEKRKIKKGGERWIAELQGLEEPILSQKKSIEEFIARHTVDKFETPHLEVHQLLNCEVFKSLDKTDLLKYIKTQEKNYSEVIKLSNSVHGFLSSLNFVYNDITKRFNEYLENASKHVELFNEHLQQMNRSFAMYGVAIEKDTGKRAEDNPVFSQMNGLFKKHITPFIDTGDIELFSLQKEFIVNLGIILSKYRADENIQEISIHLSNCNMEIRAIRMEKRYLSENFGNIIEYLVKSKNNLEKLVNNLSKKKNG
jgi:hypothetical protein